MSINTTSNLYKKITLPPAINRMPIVPQMYKGFSTVNAKAENFSLFDMELVKQDIINHFYIRQGERLMNPTFGSIIWDMLFEPLTEDIKQLIIQNVNEIINYDPRVAVSNVIVSSYDTGIQIECALKYLPYNVSEQLRFRFDQQNNIITRE